MALPPAPQNVSTGHAPPGMGSAFSGPGSGRAPIQTPTPAQAQPINPYGAQAQAYYAKLNQNTANDAWNASNQQYINAFNQHYGESQARLQSNLQQALGELGQRRDAAAQVVAGLPGQINSSYNFASGLLNSSEKAGLGALSKDVRGGASAYNAPAQETLALNRTAGQNLAPFLNLGMLANYQSGAAGLRQQEMVGEQGLADQRANFDMEQLRTKSQHDQTIADQNAAWAHQDAATASQRAWEEKQANKEHGWKEADIAAQNQSALNAQPTAEQGLQGTGLTTGEVDELRNSTDYKSIAAEASKGDKASINAQQLTNRLQSQGARGLKLLALLQRENPSFFSSGGKKLTHDGSDANAWYYSPNANWASRFVPDFQTGFNG